MDEFLYRPGPDAEFALELAITTDLLFTPPRPLDPRPTLAALIAKPDWSAPLQTTYELAANFLAQVHPAEEGESRLSMVSDLVTFSIGRVWRVDDQITSRVRSAALFLELHHSSPPLDVVDLVPMVLFTIGLSSLIAAVSEDIYPGDPLRAAIPSLRH